MIGTIIFKPIKDKELFKQAMKFVCDSKNNADMLEYSDRFEIVNKTDINIINDSTQKEENTISIEERLDDIENALLELASLIGE